ncbi:Hypothetical_protein [Hexamita inflata]|uniref:Hypothetical_protein n=1 Tax=Hexamita inflata TaxID=28002 RepID=A0AA86NTJ7_9EUKA|nr:Hypothetical protein HINF_LOCUS12758 [Hexamita inflata]
MIFETVIFKRFENFTNLRFNSIKLVADRRNDHIQCSERRCFCQQYKEVDTLNFFLKLKSQSPYPLMKQQLSQDGQCYYVPAWVLCFKTRVKSKIRSCNFFQFSNKQIFGKYQILRTKAKRKLQSRGHGAYGGTVVGPRNAFLNQEEE